MLKSNKTIQKINSPDIVFRQQKFKLIRMPERNFLSELEINALLSGVINLIKTNIPSKEEELKDKIIYEISSNNFNELYNMYIEKQRECTRLKNEMLFLKKTILLIQKQKT